jgi:hypothetical protein
MNYVRRTIDLDVATDARLRALAAERGKDEAAVQAEAVALLDSVVEIDAPDFAEDRLRLGALQPQPRSHAVARGQGLGRKLAWCVTQMGEATCGVSRAIGASRISLRLCGLLV